MGRKITLNDQQFSTALLVGDFNTRYDESIVELKLLDRYEYASFQIYFKIHDRFVDSDIYDSGTAVIYPNEAVYEAIQEIVSRIAPNAEISWNNTRSTGWLSFK